MPVGEFGDGDWWFKVSECVSEGWDNDPSTMGSRFFVITLYLLVVGSIIALSYCGLTDTPDDASDNAKKEDSGFEPTERLWHLDFARIVGVACVVVDHSGGSENYTGRNVGFVLQWVMPFLFLTSGMSFMFSRQHLLRYIARLFVVTLIGVSANLTADVYNSRDWQSDFGNTIYQIFYCICLILCSIVTAPLRRSLRWRQKHPTERAGIAVWTSFAFYGLVTAAAFVVYLSGKSLMTTSPFSGSADVEFNKKIEHLLGLMPLIVIQLFGSLFLCTLSVVMGSTHGLLGWFLLIWIFVPRVIIPYEKVGMVHVIELYGFGMVAHTQMLSGFRTIARYGRAYWPIGFGFLLFISMPSLEGRCDNYPAIAYRERCRFYLVECILIIAFTSGVFHTADPLGVTSWLNPWALYAYCCHVAWDRVLPRPYGALFTFSSSFFFLMGYAFHTRPATIKSVPTSKEKDIKSVPTIKENDVAEDLEAI